MITVSYCSTCKGRLWQIKQTLHVNLNKISTLNGVDLILLDYHSEDGLEQYVKENFQNELILGKLKYFKLISKAPYFDASYAKNIAHCLSHSDIVFNLDADNFIGETYLELINLNRKEILINQDYIHIDKSGRIGLYREDFYALRGYNEAMKGVLCEDGELAIYAMSFNFKFVKSNDKTVPIKNTLLDKNKYTDPKNKIVKMPKIRNRDGYAKCIVEDWQGNIIQVGH